MAKNISKVYLLDVPLEDDLKNTLYFANESSQHTYFENNIGKTYNNVSYQSETRTFRCPDHIDTVRRYNYLMWQNTAYSNKWFYAFIKKMNYVSDGYTDVEFEVDPLQTFKFDITIRPSFIEREHTNDDSIGKNTYPEDLEIGEYVVNGALVHQIFAQPIGVNQYRIIAAVSDLSPLQIPEGFTNYPIYNSIPSGLTYIVLQDVSKIDTIARVYDQAGKSEAINSIFIVPYGSIDDNSISWQSGFGFLAMLSGTHSLGTFTCARPLTINGYTPKNNKLLTYPYSCFYISNNAGADVTMRWEDFTNGTATFESFSVINPGCSIKTIPKNYKNTGSDDWNDGVMGCKMPVCGWNSDTYTNWLTQNGVNFIWEDTKNALSLAGSAFLPMPIAGGAAVAAINQIGSTLNERQRMKVVPDQAKGSSTGGDINFAHGKTGFSIYPMSIKSEYAAIVDDYMSMFGYKTCRVKVPNVAHRANWWYTKTVDVNITGNVPNDYLNKIKQAYNNGLTTWRNPANFLDYSVSNGIV